MCERKGGGGPLLCDSRKSLADVFHVFVYIGLPRKRDVFVYYCNILCVTRIFWRIYITNCKVQKEKYVICEAGKK